MTDYDNSLSRASISSMKFTIDGRPTVNEIHDLFSALMVQIKLSNHKFMFRNYPDTFTSEEALQELSSLKYTQSHFTPSIRYPTELKRTKTTTTFNVERDMAKALLQQFIWTRLIESATESQNRTYKDKGIWKLKNKGLCVLQDFCLRTKSEITHSKINMNCFKALSLIDIERNVENDRFVSSKKHLLVLFTILVASLPIGGNEKEKQKTSQRKRIGPPVNPLQFDFFSDGPPPSRMGSTRSGKSGGLSFNDSSTISSSSSQGSSGLPSLGGMSINDVFPSVKVLTNDMFISGDSESDSILQSHESSSTGTSFLKNKFKMCAMFTTEIACEWLVENCTLASRDEAENIMTEFLRFGWIKYVDDKNRKISEVEANGSLVHVTRAGVNVVVDLSSEQYENLHESPYSMSYKRNSVISYDNSGTKNTLYLPISAEKEIDTGRMTYTPLAPLTCTTNFESTMSPTYRCQESFSPRSSPNSGSLRYTTETKTTNLATLKNILDTPQLLLLFREFLTDAFHMISVDSSPEKPGFVINTNSTVYSLIIFFKWFDCVNEKLAKIMAMDYIPNFTKTTQYKNITRTGNHEECELDDFPQPPNRKNSDKSTTSKKMRSDDILSQQLMNDSRAKTEYIYIH
ncbi:hypothetical protein K501DRAFT_265718 [Backusella circina FSU 941]|nr:hypothetical protein K501DRAFT_265718 [Backusella circina FSU 941]